jgi:hypothetical protein
MPRLSTAPWDGPSLLPRVTRRTHAGDAHPNEGFSESEQTRSGDLCRNSASPPGPRGVGRLAAHSSCLESHGTTVGRGRSIGVTTEDLTEVSAEQTAVNVRADARLDELDGAIAR